MKYVITGIVIITVAAMVLIAWLVYERHTLIAGRIKTGQPLKGDLNAAKEKQLLRALDSAATVMGELVRPPSNIHDQFNILETEAEQHVRAWLTTYHQTRKNLDA